MFPWLLDWQVQTLKKEKILDDSNLKILSATDLNDAAKKIVSVIK